MHLAVLCAPDSWYLRDLQRAGGDTILRDLGLAVPGVVLAIWPARHLSVDQSFLGRSDAFSPGTAPPSARTLA